MEYTLCMLPEDYSDEPQYILKGTDKGAVGVLVGSHEEAIDQVTEIGGTLTIKELQI